MQSIREGESQKRELPNGEGFAGTPDLEEKKPKRAKEGFEGPRNPEPSRRRTNARGLKVTPGRSSHENIMAITYLS